LKILRLIVWGNLHPSHNHSGLGVIQCMSAVRTVAFILSVWHPVTPVFARPIRTATIQTPTRMASSATKGSEGFRESFWNNIAGNYDKPSPKSDAYRDSRLQFLLSKSYFKKEDEVLDFACATGRLALDISPHVKSVLGVDLSGGMIDQAKAKVADKPSGNVAFETLDIFDPSLDARRFNVICAMNVFHLLPNPSMFARRMHTIMAPNALLIAETPCMASKPWYFRTIIGVVSMTGLIPKPDYWTKEGIEDLVKAEGFELLEGLVLEGGDPLLVARKKG